MLIDQIGMEEYTRRHLRVGNPPDFQGDERNVIFRSFVANSNSYAATQQTHAQWANVAASRAQDQLWAFYSMDPSSLNERDYRRDLIEYVRDYGTDDEVHRELPSSVETGTSFEKDVFAALCELGYREKTIFHYRVGRYFIDYVVDMGYDCRIAIECDGDRNASTEHDKDDIERQHVLERLGWRFIRLSAPSFYLNPDNTRNLLKGYLRVLSDDAQSKAELIEEAASHALEEPGKAPSLDEQMPEPEDNGTVPGSNSEEVPSKVPAQIAKTSGKTLKSKKAAGRNISRKNNAADDSKKRKSPVRYMGSMWMNL